MPNRQPPKERFMRRPEVIERTGLPRATIYERMAEGTFPRPIRIGKMTVAWRETEIDAWILAQIEANERQRQRERQGESECAA